MKKKLNSKLFITAVLFFTTCSIFGQNQELDSCGLDTLSLLNRYESNYLNEVFSVDDFNFENKIVKFRFANYGHFSENKVDYFRKVKEWKKLHDDRIHEEVIILSDEEKVKYGNFDAVIVTWSKIPVTKTDRSRKKTLKKTLKRR